MPDIYTLLKLPKRSFKYSLVVNDDEQAMVVGRRRYKLTDIKAVQVVGVSVVGAATRGITFSVMLILFWQRMTSFSLFAYLCLIALSAWQLKTERFCLELVMQEKKVSLLYGNAAHLTKVASTITLSLSQEFRMAQARRALMITEIMSNPDNP